MKAIADISMVSVVSIVSMVSYAFITGPYIIRLKADRRAYM